MSETQQTEVIKQARGPLKPEFGVHLLNDEGIEKAKEMAHRFSELLAWLELPDNCVSSRELSLAKTKLEEACFYAKKAMATNLLNQKVQ